MVIYLILGIVIGAVLCFLILRPKFSVSEALIKTKQDDLDKLTSSLEKSKADNSNLRSDNIVLTNKIQSVQEQMKKDAATQKEMFDRQLEIVRGQLQNATAELLKKRAEELKLENNSQMGNIINPLLISIDKMKKEMNDSRDNHNRVTSALEKTIEEMMKRTNDIGKEADKLASALRGDNKKIQGNWGEVVLSRILESQGLKEGENYDVQTAIRDSTGNIILNSDSGSKMIPDVVLHYPDMKDAIIDSKVSLTAYIDYMEAEDEEMRKNAISRHLISIEKHVKELKDKDYAAYIKEPRQSLGYVIMFVPNEGALQLALMSKPSLWREAFQSGVFITGEQNLIAALKIIQLAWTQHQQTKSQKQIFDIANQMIKNVGMFSGRFAELGKKIESVKLQYEETEKKLSGKQSILLPARKLVEMGASEDTKYPLPELETDN